MVSCDQIPGRVDMSGEGVVRVAPKTGNVVPISDSEDNDAPFTDHGDVIADGASNQCRGQREMSIAGFPFDGTKG